MQSQPPGFIGRLFDNTVSRYNAFYNSDLVYSTSIKSAQKGYQEDYESLFAPSVQDAVARDGAVSGEMDKIIEKTTAMIEKKPYSKWVDDHFLLNGIAHYIKGDYEMAEKIFRYVSSEYQTGVQDDRVTSRQKFKGLDRAKQQRDDAKERLKDVEEEQKQREQEIQEAEKERRLTAKERAKEAKRKKKRNKRLKKEAEKEYDKRVKDGRTAEAEVIVKEIKEREKEVEKKKNNISDQDRERLAKAPTLKMDESKQKEGLLAHELASKDALLWLAKTYITTEQFIKAEAILTAINEDEYFPVRLNTDYYLTYADMHIRLDNYPKAIEYVQLAIETTPRRGKGRLYYLVGQLYAAQNDWENATIAFDMVEKYQPYYDMIYHAKINVIHHAFEEGQFATTDFVTPLKKMTRDAKNDDFLDEVYYYLGQAYSAQNLPKEAIDAYSSSIENAGSNQEVQKNTYLALAYQYFDQKDFGNAQVNFDEAIAMIEEGTAEHETVTIYKNSTTAINQNIATIHKQDSLLLLAELTDEEQYKFLDKKVTKEMREEFRSKLNEENESFGSQPTNRGNQRNNRNATVDPNQGFYFYDIQQSTVGYSQFKQDWGTRPNVDNWRRKRQVEKNRSRARGNQVEQYEEVTIDSKDQRIANYLLEIPNTSEQKIAARDDIYEAYLNLIDVFQQQLGDEEMVSFYEQELAKRNPPQSIYANRNETNQQVVGTSTQADEAQMSEYEKLYDLTYASYKEGKFEKALDYAEQASSFQDSSLNDKFAFIVAMSKGKLGDNELLKAEMKKFAQQYPNSTLAPQALSLINQ